MAACNEPSSFGELVTREPLGAARQQYASLFEQLSCRTYSHRGFICRFATCYRYRLVFFVCLAARESMIASHERKAGVSLDPKDFGIRLILKHDYRGSIFRY